MPEIEALVEVRRAAVFNNGTLHILMRSTTGKWQGDRFWKIPNGTPGSASFIGIALTCISTGLHALMVVDDTLTEGDDLHYLSAVRDL